MRGRKVIGSGKLEIRVIAASKKILKGLAGENLFILRLTRLTSMSWMSRMTRQVRGKTMGRKK
jgi:hypothetical protein